MSKQLAHGVFGLDALDKRDNVEMGKMREQDTHIYLIMEINLLRLKMCFPPVGGCSIVF